MLQLDDLSWSILIMSEPVEEQAAGDHGEPPPRWTLKTFTTTKVFARKPSGLPALSMVRPVSSCRSKLGENSCFSL